MYKQRHNGVSMVTMITIDLYSPKKSEICVDINPYPLHKFGLCGPYIIIFLIINK